MTAKSPRSNRSPAATAPRTVRTAVTRALAEARDAGRIRPWHEPAAVLAKVVAGQVDQAAKDNRGGEVVRLSKTMRELLDALPLVDEPEEAKRDDDGDASGGTDPLDDELEQLVGSEPAVGHSAQP